MRKQSYIKYYEKYLEKYIIEMNLLDLNNDVLNIIGVYVKKDNLERKIIKDTQMRSDKQIINGKEIRFCPYFYGIKDRGHYFKR